MEGCIGCILQDAGGCDTIRYKDVKAIPIRQLGRAGSWQTVYTCPPQNTRGQKADSDLIGLRHLNLPSATKTFGYFTYKTGRCVGIPSASRVLQ